MRVGGPSIASVPEGSIRIVGDQAALEKFAAVLENGDIDLTNIRGIISKRPKNY